MLLEDKTLSFSNKSPAGILNFHKEISQCQERVKFESNEWEFFFFEKNKDIECNKWINLKSLDQIGYFYV